MNIDEAAAMKKFGKSLLSAFGRQNIHVRETIFNFIKEQELSEENQRMLDANLHEIKHCYESLLSCEEIYWRKHNQLTCTRPLMLDAGSLLWMTTGHMRIDALFDEMQRLSS